MDIANGVWTQRRFGFPPGAKATGPPGYSPGKRCVASHVSGGSPQKVAVEDRGNLLKERELIIAIALPFLFWLFRYMGMDLWYDEVFTLKNFVFVPLGKTVTDYSFPNNHIFYNLINNVYLKAIGVKDLFSLMGGEYKIRLPPLVYTLVTLAYIYLIGRKFFNGFVARLALIILVTTVPFYNFALQARGYGLSTMLLCVTLYHVWSFDEKPRATDAALVVLSTALCLYTIPVNLYVISGLALFYLLPGAVAMTWRRGGGDQAKLSWQALITGNKRLVIALLIGLGSALSVLLYLPVIDQMLNNPYVEGHGPFHAPILLDALPRVTYYFISGRYLVALVSILGFIGYAVSKSDKDSDAARKAACCLAMFITPFVLSFLRGDPLLLRLFVNLTPVFALLAAIGIHFLRARVFPPGRATLLITVGMLLYCNATFAFGMNKIDERLGSDIENGRKSQDIFYNYYQAHFYPSRMAEEIARFDDGGPQPWEQIIVYRCDPAMPAYLRKLAIRVSAEWDIGLALTMRDRAYVVTSAPTNFEKMVAEKYPNFECKRLDRRFQYHQYFALTKLKD